MSSSAHQTLIRYWADTHSDVEFGPSDEEDVAALEARYGVRLPVEFRTYLLYACPKDGAIDRNNTKWWSLPEIKNIPDESPDELTNAEIARDAATFLFFADFLVWSGAWAICCRPGDNYGRVAEIHAGEHFVADGFVDFVNVYVRDYYELM
jgi:hypothetical protein